MKDRLIGLLTKTFDEQYQKRMLITPQHTADHLIDNGVIVPPVNAGQTVWVYNQSTNNVYENKVICIKIASTNKYKNSITVEYRNKCGETSRRKFTWAQIGRQLFLTEEDAVDALVKGVTNERAD